MADPRHSMLTVDHVTKRFGGITAVDSVTFSMGPTESVGLVGPNGAGKTTLFNCICGQLEPNEGSVIFDGARIDELPTYRRSRLGIGRTYQRIEVFPDLTVREHLVVAEQNRYGDATVWRDLLNLSALRAEEQARVDETLYLVGLADRADVPVAALGLGTCRLVELARALVSSPRLLLADEPSSGLDVAEATDLANVLRTLQQEHGMAVLLVEHNLDMVARVVDRAIVMDLGALIVDGPFDEVVKDPVVRRAYLGTE